VWLVGWLVCAGVRLRVCAFVSAFVCSFRGLFACVLSFVQNFLYSHSQKISAIALVAAA
jgi:hypothetical protein